MSIDLASTTSGPSARAVAQKMIGWFGQQQMSAGSRIPSERTLAACLGVSRKAVQGALTILEEAGGVRAVSPRIRELDHGWRLFGRLSGHVIGLTSQHIVRHGGVTDPTMEDTYVLCQAAELLREEGASPIFLDTLLMHEMVHRERGDLSLSALMLSSNDVGALVQPALLERLAKRCPVFLFGQSESFDTCDCVVSDHASGGYRLTRWLIGQGRRRILFVHLYPMTPLWMRERHYGFERALREHGLPVAPPVAVPMGAEMGSECSEHYEHGARLIAGYLAEHLLGDGAVDAIVTGNDASAMQIGSACRKLGREPGRDVLVAGYDHAWEHLAERRYEAVPPAVTCDKRNEHLAQELATLVTQRLTGMIGAERRRVMVEPELIVPLEGGPSATTVADAQR